MMDIAWLMAIDDKSSVVMNLEPDAFSVESSLNFLGDGCTLGCFVADLWIVTAHANLSGS